MSSISNYMFNNLGRLDADPIDNSQRNLQNTRFTGYMLSSYFSDSLSSASIDFATAQPAMNLSGLVGAGVAAGFVDVDSRLLINTEQERSLEKLQLMQRPFLTVPYLGRGSCDPSLESQLQQGENVADKKSVATVMTKSFMGYTLYPTDDKMNEHVNNPAYTVEEAALDGWVRGGVSSRDMTTGSNFSKNSRPTNNSY